MIADEMREKLTELAPVQLEIIDESESPNSGWQSA